MPVFVDRTGRRRRPIVVAGVLVGVALLTSLVLLLVGLFTGSPVPVPGWPDGAAQEQELGGGRGGAQPSGAPTSPVPNRPPGLPAATPQPAPSVTPSTAGLPQPTPTVTSRPGQGDEHRATPRPKPSKSSGKP